MTTFALTVFCNACVLFAATSWSAPIATNTALPLGAYEIIVRGQLLLVHSSDRLGVMQREVNRVEGRAVLAKG